MALQELIAFIEDFQCPQAMWQKLRPEVEYRIFQNCLNRVNGDYTEAAGLMEKMERKFNIKFLYW